MDLEHSVQCKNQRSNLSENTFVPFAYMKVDLLRYSINTISVENVRESIARGELTMNADYLH